MYFQNLWILCFLCWIKVFGRIDKPKKNELNFSLKLLHGYKSQTQKMNQMNIEIWSDIVCPWCYIGKRRLENALAKFQDRQYLNIEYKSYQLDPTRETDPNLSIEEYLSERKGMAIEQAQEMTTQISKVASSVGLDYKLSNAIPINTLQAHELLHFAKAQGKQLELKERLMKAYFIETLNLDDTAILINLASEVGLDKEETYQVLHSKQYASEVQNDISVAVQLGIRGVPFFVFDRKYAISGAQEEQVFLDTLNKSYQVWRQANPLTNLELVSEGDTCKSDGTCE